MLARSPSLAGVFGITAATLMLQVVRTRLFSVQSWYHLAFFVISIVPVIEATAARRHLAAYTRRLGEGPVDIVARAWHGCAFEATSAHLVALTPMVDRVAQLHLAYPILHYFHSPEADTALPVRLGALDEALTILSVGVASDHRLAPPSLEPLRRAVGGYLEVLHSAHIEPSDAAPPIQALSPLDPCGIPTTSQARFNRVVRSLDQRRRRLLGLVQADGWQWEDVVGEACTGVEQEQS